MGRSVPRKLASVVFSMELTRILLKKSLTTISKDFNIQLVGFSTDRFSKVDLLTIPD